MVRYDGRDILTLSEHLTLLKIGSRSSSVVFPIIYYDFTISYQSSLQNGNKLIYRVHPQQNMFDIVPQNPIIGYLVHGR